MAKKREHVVEIIDGVWYLDKFSQHECCHCSLVHDTEYKVEKGRIFTRWTQNDKATKEQRKKLGIKVTRANTKT